MSWMEWYNGLARPSWTPAPATIRLIWQILYLLVVWPTIVWSVIVVWPHHRRIAVAQTPYFVWVSLATALPLSITWMNRRAPGNRRKDTR